MTLTTLPILPLEAIISYLDFSSIVSFSNSHPSFAHLQPKEQIVIGEDFCISGKGGCMHMPQRPKGVCEYLSQDFHKMIIEQRQRQRQPYFDVKVETKGLLSIKMVWEWKSQV